MFQILLVNKQDGRDYQFLAVVLPLFISLFTLILMSFGTKGGNQCKWNLLCEGILGLMKVVEWKATVPEMFVLVLLKQDIIPVKS